MTSSGSTTGSVRLPKGCGCSDAFVPYGHERMLYLSPFSLSFFFSFRSSGILNKVGDGRGACVKLNFQFATLLSPRYHLEAILMCYRIVSTFTNGRQPCSYYKFFIEKMFEL
jgi:hypothetical protein